MRGTQFSVSFLSMITIVLSQFSVASAESTWRIQHKVTKALNKYAIKSTKGKVGHHTKISRYDYSAKNCELRIHWHLEWHNAQLGRSDTDKGANYTIPLRQVELKPISAPKRIKLSCTPANECITKRFHKSCERRRRCKQTKTYNDYFIRLTADRKQSLSKKLRKLIRRCKTAPKKS